MENRYKTEIFDDLAAEMVLSESMKNQLRQICVYAVLSGIDIWKLRAGLKEEGRLPCPDKNSSKKVLSEIYDYVACSF